MPSSEKLQADRICVSSRYILQLTDQSECVANVDILAAAAISGKCKDLRWVGNTFSSGRFKNKEGCTFGEVHP